MYIYLSHKIKQINPGYGKGSFAVEVTRIKSIKSGDSCNTYRLAMDNHIGTHVDAPAHFFTNGKNISDYRAQAWVFNHPFVLRVALKPGQIIVVNDFKSVPKNTDILLIKSGFQRFRGKDIYGLNNPGISAGAALWLRRNYPFLKAVGVDFISVSPYRNRKLGGKTHAAFLDPAKKNKPVLIIEDMNLKHADNRLGQLWVFPLRFTFCDSAPATVVGKRQVELK